jgi:hypothetical protein
MQKALLKQGVGSFRQVNLFASANVYAIVFTMPGAMFPPSPQRRCRSTFGVIGR